MIPFEKAFEIVMSRAQLLGTDTVALREACSRILAADITSDLDIPPFDKSAMDGYACRRADLPGPLRIIETIQAGASPRETVNPGECAKIMTGAMLPSGADCVIMVEYTEVDASGKALFLPARSQIEFGNEPGFIDANICYRGEDVHKGDIVLQRGARIGPQHVAVLATVGCAMPRVARRPRVAVIATGDELVEPDANPGAAQIRNSNSYQICAQIERTGAVVTYFGIAPDTVEALDAIMKRAMNENDVLLLSGGVSMGDFDLVPGVMTSNGFEILFDAIAMKPGKPTTFGVSDTAYCFGLPGNPVSTFVQCEILIKPFLYALMGHRYQPPCSFHPLDTSYNRKKTARDAWVPVALTDEGAVRPVPYHGSAHINALCDAYGFIVVSAGVATLEKGAMTRVQLIDATA